MRLAYGRIAQETNSWSPADTTEADFRRFHWLEGEDLRKATHPGGHEAHGFTKKAELAGFVDATRGKAELVPLFSAWAIPGGPLSAELLATFRARLVASLEAAGPIDGLYLSMHGAMSARGQVDPEARLLEDARRVLGPDIPIAVSYDLHGQMTREKMGPVTIPTAYRTNPHRDHARVGKRTGDLLLRAAAKSIRPVTAWRSLPMLLGGGTTIDFGPTMRPIYRWMRRQERDPKVLYVSLFNCHVWNDHPELGWSSVVVTDGDEALANRLADELAERLWAVRKVALPDFPGASEAIGQVRESTLLRKLGTICVCDLSDVVGAGAPGENTALIRAVLAEGADLRVYAPIRDPDFVAQVWELPLGSTVEGTVGGRLDPVMNPPLPIRGILRSKGSRPTLGREIVVEIGRLSLVVSEQAPLAMQPAFYKDVGLDPWKADMVIVKSLFPFRWFFLASNRKSIYARTQGVTDFDWVHRIQRARPVWPRNDIDDWRPADRERRG